jgi:hypothetical protein
MMEKLWAGLRFDTVSTLGGMVVFSDQVTGISCRRSLRVRVDVLNTTLLLNLPFLLLCNIH